MLNIGMVGVGCISGIYLENFANTFKNVRLVAVCDLIRERAENAQKKYNIPKLYDTMEELFADPEIDVVLNLTRPYQHYEVSKAALLAGKHVYSEKPLGITFEEGKSLVALANEKGLVPENSILFYQALQKHKIPTSMHIFPIGGHGWGYRESFRYHEMMKAITLDWLDLQGFIEKKN